MKIISRNSKLKTISIGDENGNLKTLKQLGNYRSNYKILLETIFRRWFIHLKISVIPSNRETLSRGSHEMLKCFVKALVQDPNTADNNPYSKQNVKTADIKLF